MKEKLADIEDLVFYYNEINTIERTFQKKRRYESRYGAKTRDGLRPCQEITIAKICVQNLADYCIDKQKDFLAVDKYVAE